MLSLSNLLGYMVSFSDVVSFPLLVKSGLLAVSYASDVSELYKRVQEIDAIHFHQDSCKSYPLVPSPPESPQESLSINPQESLSLFLTMSYTLLDE